MCMIKVYLVVNVAIFVQWYVNVLIVMTLVNHY